MRHPGPGVKQVLVMLRDSITQEDLTLVRLTRAVEHLSTAELRSLGRCLLQQTHAESAPLQEQKAYLEVVRAALKLRSDSWPQPQKRQSEPRSRGALRTRMTN
jgi:hypothetical protein